MFWRKRSTVELRAEHDGPDHRYLTAYRTRGGGLTVAGQDLGPATAMVSPDGEYEWWYVVPPASVPRLLEALGARPGTDVLDELAARWCGAASSALEGHLRELRHEGLAELTVR